MRKTTETIESYISDRSAAVREILKSLRTLIRKTLPESTEGMKWGAPVFFNKSGAPVIYIYGGKDHANLGFIAGVDLNDPSGLLEGSGKSGRHVKIYPDKPVLSKQLIALIKQCAWMSRWTVHIASCENVLSMRYWIPYLVLEQHSCYLPGLLVPETRQRISIDWHGSKLQSMNIVLYAI